MTNRPVPPSFPWLSSRARFVSVPGLSLPYQLKISFTRSVLISAFRPYHLQQARDLSTQAAASFNERVTLTRKKWSERQDLNLRRLGPKPSALARLSYAPTLGTQYPLFRVDAQFLLRG